ncbi:Cu(I)-responsive transcriptional regulator [Sneathiella chinensis]|uniref:Cu(I)-responsive transcriptional regulator n=1 Tax=Sneathiella chinensis TaxID=349750 RepID=A0ABQ5U2J9_9PROT|nr:Cu(I)-responsive transcriptional regulator [Sneathiella chinensis]GLQ06053.1 Cu(I)-responsive transcriptional regulator [Sneathiella chinensis]
MNIGTAAERSGLPAKTLRYYETIDLVQPLRADNGYRDYSEDDLHCLKFVGRARSLGFSIEECRVLLSLYRDQNRSSGEVKSLALHKVTEIEKKIGQLQDMKKMLSKLAGECHGDNRPDCPILDEIAGEQA